MKPVMPSIMTSVEEPHQAAPPQIEHRLASPPPVNSPHLGSLLPVANINSPKRPLEDADDGGQPRKLARGESPALRVADLMPHVAT
jgi:cleavage stimulation factor subunit 3